VTDLEQLCCHAIYHTTFFHSWVNDGQVAAGARPDFARLGLDRSFGPAPPPSAAAAEHEAWLEGVRRGGGLCDMGYQMLIAHILTGTRVGTIDDVPLGAAMPRSTARALGRLGAPRSLIRVNVNA